MVAGGADLDLTFRKIDSIPPDQPAEVWGGHVNALLQKLELRFRVYAPEGGEKYVRMDSVQQKAGGFKGELRIDGDTSVIEVPALKGTFTGSLGPTARSLWAAGNKRPFIQT